MEKILKIRYLKCPKMHLYFPIGEIFKNENSEIYYALIISTMVRSTFENKITELKKRSKFQDFPE